MNVEQEYSTKSSMGSRSGLNELLWCAQKQASAMKGLLRMTPDTTVLD